MERKEKTVKTKPRNKLRLYFWLWMLFLALTVAGVIAYRMDVLQDTKYITLSLLFCIVFGAAYGKIKRRSRKKEDPQA